MPAVKDETGKIYGKLTVLERNGSIRGLAAWKCKCECGNIVTVPGAYLRNGNTTSCGCRKYEGFEKQREIQNKSSIKIGDKFGKLTILKELDLRPHGTQGHRRRWYLCQCECGNVIEAMGNSLKSKLKTSCGCIHSKGEEKIEKVLKENNINYKKEVIDERLANEYGRRLRFDFGIYDNNDNLIKYIEFDGRQHTTGMDTECFSHSDPLELIKERDSIKNDFCKKYNIPLKRIQYYEIDKINLDFLLK